VSVSRAEVLALLGGQKLNRRPVFSGLISVVEAGLESAGLRFHECHTDAARMAVTASSSFRLFGFESANLPLDMCVEAEALGAEVDFREDAPGPAFPICARPLAASAAGFTPAARDNFAERGRIPLVAEAIRRLKVELGDTVAIGAWVPGPFTLALQVIEVPTLMTEVVSAPEAVRRVLDALTEALAQTARAYRAAGADFITIHEMGGSPGVVGPRSFQKLILPPLQRLVAALPAPRVVSACGRTDRFMPLLAESGAEALNVDHQNDLAKSRAALGPAAILLGNLDPVATLANGSPEQVRAAVRQAAGAGADALWPGCDLWPRVPAENMWAWMDEAASQVSTGG
jgi:[methyl-Co(III) methanol-specific corrinoid protein]:coenzyme M methyltransferase